VNTVLHELFLNFLSRIDSSVVVYKDKVVGIVIKYSRVKNL
jgi:hypothetical protein